MIMTYKEFINSKAFEQDYLEEKLIIVGGGKKYGQIIFLAGGAGCFAPDTEIQTDTGNKKIYDIKSGDMIWTANEETGEKELQEVQKLYEFTQDEIDKEILELTFEDGTTVVCTEDHEFLIDGVWVQAKDL